MLPWRGNLSEIKIPFQYLKNIQYFDFWGMAESSDIFGCPKKFQTVIIWMCFI